MHIIFNLFTGLQFLLGVALIYVVTIQESKNEGLTGQIGSTVSTAFKGKAGREERLNQLTKNIAVVWIISSVVVAVGANRW